MNNYRNKHIILDFTNTELIDSSFLGSLIIFFKRITAAGGSLSLVINQEKTIIFSPIKNIIKMLDIYFSVDDAISGLSETIN